MTFGLYCGYAGIGCGRWQGYWPWVPLIIFVWQRIVWLAIILWLLTICRCCWSRCVGRETSQKWIKNANPNSVSAVACRAWGFGEACPFHFRKI